MKIRTILGGLAIGTMAMIAFSAFRSVSTEEATLNQLSGQYEQGLFQVLESIKDLSAATRAWEQGDLELEVLQASFVESRLVYKRNEALLNHLAPIAVLDHINGAPLPHVERKAPNLIVIPPEGYQRIDELIFGEEGEDKTALAKQTAMLEERFERIMQDQARTTLSHRLVFESARFGLLRLATLGITGFDTPTSGQAMPEALATLKGIRDLIEPYYPALAGKGTLDRTLKKRFDGSIRYLTANQDFDSFDRLTFIRDHLNPLFAELLDAHYALGYETIREVNFRKQSINYEARSLFDPQLINALYYTDLQASTDTPEARELGKLLFFDPILSRNVQRSCASCHQPEKGFTDGLPKSTATDFEGTVARNAPTLLNALYADKYFYDLRAEKPATQIELVVHNEQEFDLDYTQIFERLEQSEDYKELFKKAFPKLANAPFKRHTLSMAMVAYLKSLQSMNSPVDQYVRGETKELPANVKNGFNLFMGKAACGTCHFAPVFNGSVPPYFHESESEVLGVLETHDTLNPVLNDDPGRIASGVLKYETEIYYRSFKTVTVRNIDLTGPYMHHGGYKTLDEIVDFYNRGGGQGMGLDVPNQTLPPDPLGLTKTEQQDLVAFMQALTDTAGLTSRPTQLPQFEHHPEWNKRTIGGDY